MKFGLFGYPNAGKKTLFELLTGEPLNGRYSEANTGAIPGAVPVRDRRLDRLAELYRPQKVTPAVLEFLLVPEPPGAELQKSGEALEDVFRELERMDVLGVMVRDFPDDAIFHIRGSVDPLRDLREWLEELLLRDQMFVEKRLDRLQKELRTKKIADKEKEEKLFRKLLLHLETGRSLRTLTLTEDERKRLRHYSLLTRKPMLLILNVAEDRAADAEVPAALREEADRHGIQVLLLSVKIEHELAQLSPEDREPFLEELGITEPALEKLTRTVYSLLGLITYFTVGSDEVRSWAVPAGSPAPRAARAIHADIERGFIRAELMRYEDLMAFGSEEKLKSAGKMQLKGRDYIVQDGDILSFRFNV